MKTIYAILCVFTTNFGSLPNKAVEKIDVYNYAGTWYSLYSIPTTYDKGSRETSGKYTWNEKGKYYDVVTFYKKPGSERIHSIESKVYQVPGSNNSQMKVQLVWPFKVDYWVIELAPDYSYVVVGHPERKSLSIMSRRKLLDKKTYSEIVARCEARGYDTSRLVSQYHMNLSGEMSAKAN